MPNGPFIVAILSHGPFLSRWKIGSHLCRLDGFFASREANETLIKTIEAHAQYLRRIVCGIGGHKNHLELAGRSRWQFPQRIAIICICSGHMSGQWVYPKNRSFTYLWVSTSKSKRLSRGIREREFWFEERRRNQPPVIVGFAGRGPRRLGRL
jgi:hypothetical protein